MGRWGAALILSTIKSASKSIKIPKIGRTHFQEFPNSSPISNYFLRFRSFSALPSPSPDFAEEFDLKLHYFDQNSIVEEEEFTENDGAGRIPVKAFFICTRDAEKYSLGKNKNGFQVIKVSAPLVGFSWNAEILIDLKGLQAENSRYFIPPTSRSLNSIALRFSDSHWKNRGVVGESTSGYRYMVVYQYGSAVLFNVPEHEVDFYLQAVSRHGSGLLTDIRKDDYAVKEKPSAVEDMQGGPDYIVLKNLDIDSIRIISSVLGQSIALDYFVSQVDGMVEEFAEINRGMEKTGTFTMTRKKLFQLVGKANSNLADVILKVGLFERSEIAWKDAKYAQILDYLREEYEVTQRFGNLDFKLKFVEHNIHFLQEVLQNRKSDLLEWCIIVLLAIENVISVCEIVRDTMESSI
ncbi:hypothetical protein STAS_17243 [Striga asiatica]|uniref:DUF155 domain-containing protein n=1 Tax=Striga asiatica TaxID=4170 RepID=A0A5A7Q5N9_STRAF|nr:hypothetical protein STAS_17243 [Striga asiatica]